MSRADKLTPAARQPEYFSDFPIAMTKHPVTRQLARLTNADAVKQSIKLIVLTNFGEAPFKQHFGANVLAAMFENAGPFAEETISRAVKDAVTQNEPRAKIVALQVSVQPDRASLKVDLAFVMYNDPAPIPLSLILKRPR